jgi:superfamily II DNA/RNA helicase
LELDGVNVLVLNGKAKAEERTDILNQFRLASHNTVLIVSDVAMTGLNLQFATILIVLVRIAPTLTV